MSWLLPSILEIVGGGDAIPGLPSESLHDARTGRRLVEDEDKGEEGGKPDDSCCGREQRIQKAEKATAEKGHQGVNTVNT